MNCEHCNNPLIRKKVNKRCERFFSKDKVEDYELEETDLNTKYGDNPAWKRY